MKYEEMTEEEQRICKQALFDNPLFAEQREMSVKAVKRGLVGAFRGDAIDEETRIMMQVVVMMYGIEAEEIFCDHS